MPEVLPVGQETANGSLTALATVYGECLWGWSLIEAGLFLIFSAASGLVRSMTLADAEHRETLARAFFAVKGMEIRLAMTHALAQQRWEKSRHLAIWKGIHDELGKQRRVLGKIGHRSGLLFTNPGKPPIALLIDPRLHVDMAVSYQDAKNGGISLVKLLKIQQDFGRLQKRMGEFVITLVQEQHGAFAQLQAGPPLPLRTQSDQTPKGSP